MLEIIRLLHFLADELHLILCKLTDFKCSIIKWIYYAHMYEVCFSFYYASQVLIAYSNKNFFSRWPNYIFQVKINAYKAIFFALFLLTTEVTIKVTSEVNVNVKCG